MATIDEMPAPAPADRSDGETAELQAQLNQLRAAATKEDALKNYPVAAEHYSQATEIQSELNGEMSVENADLLYLYGRCLYHVAVSKSDVLGGKVAGEETKKRKREPKPEATGSASTDSAQPTDKDAGEMYLQIEGDENWMDEEEDVDEPDEPAAEEDDDDFETAYEILDVARVLLTRKLEQSEAQSVQNAGKGKAPDTGAVSPATRAIMERLADTRDLQAEISLENERWPDAVADERASLEIKQRIFPIESSLIAEAHFKLSLALEFASVTTMAADSNDPDGADVPENAASGQMDQRARDESVQHMEKAIESCRARIAKEKAALATETEGSDKHTQARKGIEDVEDMIKDMETRVSFFLRSSGQMVIHCKLIPLVARRPP